MINYIKISRWTRLIKSEAFVPNNCKSLWWYTDVYEKCNCKNTCKFSDYSKEDWVKYANQYYSNLKNNKTSN